MKNIKIYILAFILVIIDRVLKLTVSLNMKLSQSIVLVKDFFKIYYLKNSGAAFSSFSGMRYLLIIISILIFILIIMYLEKNDIFKKHEKLSFSLIIGGLVGNLIDRVIYGSVIDYLSFTIFGNDFAVFNFADMCITVGVILLLFPRKD